MTEVLAQGRCYGDTYTGTGVPARVVAIEIHWHRASGIGSLLWRYLHWQVWLVYWLRVVAIEILTLASMTGVLASGCCYGDTCTYTGKYDWGTGVGSLLWMSLWMLLMPLLPEEWVTDWRVVLSPVARLPGVWYACRIAGWKGVEVAWLGRLLPNMLLLRPCCKDILFKVEKCSLCYLNTKQANAENRGPQRLNKFDLEVSQRSRSRHCANWKGLSQGSCMPNINAISLILQKIWARFKFLWQTKGRRTNEFCFLKCSTAFVKAWGTTN